MRWILEQRLERTQARHLVENFRDEVVELLRIQREPLDQHILRNELLDVPADFFLRHLVQRRKIDFLDQPAVQPHFGVEQLVAEQRAFGRLRGRACSEPAPPAKRSRTRLSSADGGGSSGAGNSGVGGRRAVKRPTIASPRLSESLSFFMSGIGLSFGHRLHDRRVQRPAS